MLIISAFRHISIQRKVTLMILFASLATLLLAAVSLAVFQWVNTRQTIKRDLQAQAEILAANSTAALRFADKSDADEMLATLKAKPEIVSASLYQTNGQQFASYGKREHLPAQLPLGLSDGFQRDAQYLSLVQPVLLNGSRVGTLYLCFNFYSLSRKTLKKGRSILTIGWRGEEKSPERG